MSELVFAWFAAYGLLAVFAVLVLTSLGAPFPATLLLLALGSFVEQGDLVLWRVLVLAAAAAIVGDHLGYAIGRFGGRAALDAIGRRLGGDSMITRAEEFTVRWGAPGIFFSRWLVGALGPWVNLTSGVAAYPLAKFTLWDVLGEALWVVLYVTLGRLFSERVQELADLLSNLGWALAALVIAVLAGWELARHLRQPEASPAR